GAKSPGAKPPAGVVVVFDRGVPGAQRAAIRASAHASVVRTLGPARFQLLAPVSGQTVAHAVAALRRIKGVAAADRNATVTASSVPNDPTVPFVPNDPLFGQLWGLQNTGQDVQGFVGGVPGADISATLAWDRTVGDRSTVIADIDTGYYFEHP